MGKHRKLVKKVGLYVATWDGETVKLYRRLFASGLSGGFLVHVGTWER